MLTSSDSRDVRKLLASKHHCSPELHRVGTEALDALERAYAQACTNLATIRPSGIEGATIGDDAQRYHDALLAGWGGIEGWDDRAE